MMELAVAVFLIGLFIFGMALREMKLIGDANDERYRQRVAQEAELQKRRKERNNNA